MVKAAVVGFLILVCVVILYKFEVSGIVENAAVSQQAAIARPVNLALLKRPAVRDACKKNPSWTMDDCEAIDQKEIVIGMTGAQVLLAWGKPHSVNSTIVSGGTHEQWVYGNGDYVYVDNGVMRSRQSSK